MSADHQAKGLGLTAKDWVDGLKTAALPILLVVILLAWMASRDSSTSPASTSPAPSVQSRTKLTKNNFLQIKVGMTASDVKLILGEPTRTVQGRLIEPFVYKYNERGMEVSVFFDPNGIVIQKDQTGLD